MRVFLPRSVHVRIAAGCNLGCIQCERENLPSSGRSGRKARGTLNFTDGRTPLPIEQDMTPAMWELVKAKFMPHTDKMELGGLGEPTLAKLFPIAAADIVAAGKDLFFFTNGHYLGRNEIIEAVGQKPHISISIDAGTPEIYEKIRKGKLEDFISSVTKFRAARPDAKLDSQFTAMASNIEDLPAWVELCAKLGIGRFSAGEQLLVNAADHHATARVDESVRFMKDATEKALAEAVVIAQREGLWLISNLPAFSAANPNAITDGTDPRKLRRWADLQFFGSVPCGGTNGLTTIFATSALGARLEGFNMPDLAGAPVIRVNPIEYVTAPREVYVDYDGRVWSCLARHEIGDIAKGTWESIIEQNPDYQEFLANWFYGVSARNGVCSSCPRRK